MQDKNFISRDASTGIKGLLIFLIILGHNSFFSSETRIGMVYLYTFHIQAFFMLPFLYPHKELSFVRFRDYAVRLYYPFIIIFLFLSLINYFGCSLGIVPENVSLGTMETTDKWKEFILTLITGNGYSIDYFSGFQFLWFLPVMFSMTLIKDLYYGNSTRRILKYTILISGCFFFFVYFIFGFRAPFDKSIIYLLKEYSPFAITHALGAFFMGVCALLVIHMTKYKVANIVISIFFILGTIVCFRSQHDGEVPIDDEIRWMLLLTMPFLFFFILYQLRNPISNITILRELGKYSFPIYIIHPLLLKILFTIIYPLYGTNWGIVIASQIVIAAISYYIARFIYAKKYLKAILFPNNWNEIKGLKSYK